MLGLSVCLPSRNRRSVLRLVHEVVNQHAGYAAEEHTETDSKKRKAGVRSAEGVGRTREDEGKGGEEEKQDGEGEGGVEGEEENYGLFDVSEVFYIRGMCALPLSAACAAA